MAQALAESPESSTTAPHPGSPEMPRWNLGELPPAPQFQWKNAWQFLGPGLMMGGAAIGGGEWLMGPQVTARYGGGLLWLATLSILGQVLYNIEISRYTLYTGEPIFTGKFRTLPGPMFWAFLYLLLDSGSVLPYLASSAATPLVTAFLPRGEIPNPDRHGGILLGLAIAIFLLSLIPLIFGGKIYNCLKAIMTFKIVAVLGFLLFLAVGFSHKDTWIEIFSGFFKFGQIPTGDGNKLDNVFVALIEGRPLPSVDLSVMATLSALVAISGQGGLSNTALSNYTRDQGWGMGSHVWAIPSLVGGQNIQLSHVGTVFPINPQSLARWKGWLKHLRRDQLMVWLPACFIGLALPSMLSVQFLERGTILKNPWAGSVMTADRVGDAIGGDFFGPACRFMTLFCGFLVLAPSMASTIDGFVRRWVDVFWTASKSLHSLDPGKIRHLYFGVLLGYAAVGLTMLLSLRNPKILLDIAGGIYNYALAFSCCHVAVLNTILLPKEIRPSLLVRITLFVIGLFFATVATFAAYKLILDLKAML
ncbi:MAG: Nramp family divalent metal transporter [Planctomycetia bacterium]|nr:Nramp family divalent metal transporter [Planctomycetia bacterium]